LAIIVIGFLLWRRRKHSDKAVPSDSLNPAEQHPYGSPMPPQYGQPEKQQDGMYPEMQEMYTAPEAQELPDSSDARQK
jgi:hypothetical protein